MKHYKLEMFITDNKSDIKLNEQSSEIDIWFYFHRNSLYQETFKNDTLLFVSYHIMFMKMLSIVSHLIFFFLVHCTANSFVW